MIKYKSWIVILLFPIIISNISYSQELSGYISGESRIFPESPLDSRQHGTSFSISANPEFFFDWDDGYQSILVVPYFRLDQFDKERTHFDIRELYWLYAADIWELRLGIRKVFWGVTESQHLVDVINQSDLVENLDGEQKLGQPMVNIALIQDWGTVDIFMLAGFRERTFPGYKGRLRFPFNIDLDNSQYQSVKNYKRIDWAIRWSHTLGDFDFAISNFYGNSREPRFVGDFSGQTPKFNPQYDLMNQAGVEFQYIYESWLWKLESIFRSSRGKSFAAIVAGFEYTFSNIDDSGIDVGVIGEYMFDDRNQNFFAPNPFNNHTFIGSRLAFNDVQSTDILAGAIINNKTGSAFINVEASRRVFESFKLKLELRAFTNVRSDDFFYSFRKDGHSRIELEWYY